MMRWKYGILCGLVFSALGSSVVLADEYVLDETSYSHPAQEAPSSNQNGWLSGLPDDGIDFETYQEVMALLYPELSEDYEEEWEEDEATPSNATRSNADRPGLTVNHFASSSPVPLASYTPDDGTISTSTLQYFRDMLVKLPYDTDYVFFRVDDYEYRMVYGDQIDYSEGVFTGSGLSYIRYYRSGNYGNWLLSSGDEGSFRLTTNGYLVYSNVGDLYPDMNGGVYTYAIYACVFVLVLTLLFNLLHAFFFLGRYRF